MESPFDILRIDPDADESEIDRAYRRRVKESHPDHGGTAREFQRVRAAYREIVDDDSRGTGREGPLDSRSDPEPDPRSRVEYLNYEALADEGWDLADDDLFEKASDADLEPEDYGRILVEPHETLLEAAENRGLAWPYACRGGACANCAVAVVEGELSMPVNHVLPAELLDRGIRLSCVGGPITDDMKVVYNVKHLPNLDELRLPPRPFEQAQMDD